MSKQRKNIVATTILAATLVLTLVLTSGFIASHFGEQGHVLKVYASGVAIQDEEDIVRKFLGDILEAGGGYGLIEYIPDVHFFFENGSHKSNVMYDSIYGGTVNASGIKEIRLYTGTLQTHTAQSEEFMNFTSTGNLAWYGNYSKGSEILSSLQLGNESVDLGTMFETHVLFKLILDSGHNLQFRDPHDEYENPPPELWPIWEQTGLWSAAQWRIAPSNLLQMVGQSETASVTFEGTIWLNGNYTTTVNGIKEYGNIDVSKNVTFGRLDFTFEDGKLSTISYKIDRPLIVLFAYPEE
jgi:hypothetical protein